MRTAALAAPLIPLLLATATPAAGQRPPTPAHEPELGSVIFVHPDGAGPAHWGAARLMVAGPDGMLAWDRLERIGAYRGHLSNSVASSSHGGATAHAWGVKVPFDSYGMRGREPLVALSGQPVSVLVEAHRAGLATALVNSGHIAEPGTGVFAASAPTRGDIESITRQIIESGVDIILAGGEVLLLPAGERGHFGHPGLRRDGVNLIDRARELGYVVVYTREQLRALPSGTRRVLGVFAPGNTFNDQTEEALRALDRSAYRTEAPGIAEMTAHALRLLRARDQRFLLVAEEEGSDNFANVNNAAGTLLALQRADAALRVALDFIERNPRTLLLTTADSDAGGLEVMAVRDSAAFDQPLPPHANNGAPLDGRTGTESVPFVAQPDRDGRSLRFAVAWAGSDDFMGGIIARAHGLNADLLPAAVDNTDIYRLIYATLFGTWLP